MNERAERKPPEPWPDFHKSVRAKWLVPFLYLDWLADWAAYLLSRSALLEFLEYCGTFSILIAVIFYFIDAPERTKTKHYQAWQVINTAQGKGGSGGRTDALQDLNDDHVPLVGVDLSDAFLQGMKLEKADLRRSKFHNADLKGADLSRSNLELSALLSANLRDTNLTSVNWTDADLTDSDLNGTNLTGATLKNVDFTYVDLRNADLTDAVDWQLIASVRLTNIHALGHAPDGFAAWALSHGAVDIASDGDWNVLVNKAKLGK